MVWGGGAREREDAGCSEPAPSSPNLADKGIWTQDMPHVQTQALLKAQHCACFQMRALGLKGKAVQPGPSFPESQPRGQ